MSENRGGKYLLIDPADETVIFDTNEQAPVSEAEAEVAAILQRKKEQLGDKQTFVQDVALEIDNASAPYSFGVLYVDVDGFKPINDEYGHLVGDFMIVAVGEVLKNKTRQHNNVDHFSYLANEEGISTRLHGDEYAVLVQLQGRPERAHEISDAERLNTVASRLQNPRLLADAIDTLLEEIDPNRQVIEARNSTEFFDTIPRLGLSIGAILCHIEQSYTGSEDSAAKALEIATVAINAAERKMRERKAQRKEEWLQDLPFIHRASYRVGTALVHYATGERIDRTL